MMNKDSVDCKEQNLVLQWEEDWERWVPGARVCGAEACWHLYTFTLNNGVGSVEGCLVHTEDEECASVPSMCPPFMLTTMVISLPNFR